MTLDPHLLRSQLTGHQLLDHQLLDHQGLDLEAARRVTYVIEQSFRYEYDAPVRSLRQRLVIVPPGRHGGQHRRACQLEVAGAQARRRLLRDRNGNVVTWLRAEHVARAVEFRLTAIVERIRRDGPAVLPREALGSPALLSPTRLTAADDRLRDLAARLPATAAARWTRRSGSAIWCTPRWSTPTGSPRCGPRPRRPWRAGAASARTWPT